MSPHLPAAMVFQRREVVVDVHLPQKPGARKPAGEGFPKSIHHPSEVLLGVAQREVHIPNIVVPLGIPDRQEGQIRRGQDDVPFRGDWIA